MIHETKTMLVLAMVAVGCLSACSTTARYAGTALTLSRVEHSARGGERASTWGPLDRGDSDALSADERVRLRFFLDSCVSELVARFDPAPRRAVRAVQIAECMQARGWHLVVEEIAAPR